MSNPTRKLKLGGGTLSGQLNFSGTNHAGLKLLSLTTTQRDALPPANGMLIYNSTSSECQQYVGGSWQSVSTSPNLELYAESVLTPGFTVASGNDSVAIGAAAEAQANSAHAFGTDANANAVGATAIGYEAKANAPYSFALSLCNVATAGEVALLFATNGTASSQRALSLQGLAANTVDATPSEMLWVLGGNTSRITLSNNSALSFRASVVARRTDADGENDSWEIAGLIHRDANAASTTLDADQKNHIGSTSWDVSVSADTTNGALKFTVTGEAAKTIYWIAKIEATHLAE